LKQYDVIVVGSGCGSLVMDEALSHSLRVALVDKGPLIGGTCLNWGCIPSKMLIYTADRIVDIQEAKKFGIDAVIKGIDFNAIMERMRKSRQESESYIRKSLAETENLDFYEGEARFVADYTLEVKGERVRADKIFIACGSRPLIPPIRGLNDIEYLTNESVLELKEKPESMVIVGGGYIGVEYAHFFAAMGTRVAIVEMADRLVLSEEPEIAELLGKRLSQRIEIHTGVLAEEVRNSKDGVVAVLKDGAGARRDLSAQKIMVAVGRRSNADLLEVGNTGVETDEKGFVKADKFFETSKKNIFAIGDVNGKSMFTHSANRQAQIAVDNLLHGTKLEMDFNAVPHAVYSHPQIASVGMGEAEARKAHSVLVGRTTYFSTAKGEAMLENDGFAKAIVDKSDGAILGFHIIGPHAPEVIQEVVNVMSWGSGQDEINEGIHIHPALSELIQLTLESLEEP